MIEKTLVLVKPDGVARGLVGEVLSRFERVGFKIIGLKMFWATKDHVDKHYPKDDVYLSNIGRKSLDTYQKYSLDAKAEIGTDDPLEIGKMVRLWLLDYISSGPVVAIALEGVHAVDNIKKIAGPTLPTAAVPGTIRGDFSIDSSWLGNARKRAIKNIVHISDNPKEAEYEVNLWFTKEELFSYKRADEEAMF